MVLFSFAGGLGLPGHPKAKLIFVMNKHRMYRSLTIGFHCIYICPFVFIFIMPVNKAAKFE